jgi:hypothetical protein
MAGRWRSSGFVGGGWCERSGALPGRCLGAEPGSRTRLRQPGGRRAGPKSLFADDEGEQRLPLTKAWQIPFESCLPVREFPSYKG